MHGSQRSCQVLTPVAILVMASIASTAESGSWSAPNFVFHIRTRESEPPVQINLTQMYEMSSTVLYYRDHPRAISCKREAGKSWSMS